MIQFFAFKEGATRKTSGGGEGGQIAAFSIGQHKKFCFNALRLFLCLMHPKVTKKMQKNWRKCVNIVIAGGDSSAKSREKNTSHRKRLRSLRGRSRKRMNDQTGAAPPASIEWRSTDFGNNSGASAFRHFNHFFFVLRIYQIFLENIVRVTFLLS